MKSKTTTATYTDYSIFAEVDDLGNLKLLKDKEAVENALILWLSSFPQELIRSPSKGGNISRQLLKPVSEESATLIKEAIIETLSEDFSPALIVKKLVVEPIYEKSEWRIFLQAYCPLIKEEIDIDESMRSIT